MIHLLIGDNTFALEQQQNRIIDDFAGDVEKIDGSELTVAKLPDLLMGVTLFSPKRLIIIKNVSENRLVWGILSEWLERAGDLDAILVEKHPDRRTKTYKWLEKNAKVFVTKELQAGEAINWLKTEAQVRGSEMSHDTAQYFVEYVGVDQWRLRSELEKTLLSDAKLTKELIRDIVEPTPQATSFELLDAAFAGRHKEVENLLATVSHQEEPYMFFGLLASQVYAIAVVKSGQGKRPDEIAKEAGIHPFVVRKVMPLASVIGSGDVKRLVAQLADLDAHMKSRSVDPWTQIHLLLKSFRTSH